MTPIQLLAVSLFIVSVLGVNSTYGPLFWPLPQKYTQGNGTFSINPCEVKYRVSSVPVHLQQVVDFYLAEVFKCKKSSEQAQAVPLHPKLAVELLVTVRNTTLVSPFQGLQNYTLQANQNGSWTLRADYYPGYLRGFETFSQLFKISDEDDYYVEGLPITVTDYPQYQWRGVMIDTARHYLKIDTIKKTIDACLYNKANVLHWHITDEDSFPLQIKSRPQLTKYGSFPGKVYTKQNVLDIVQYALRKGVRVIPEIDTPGHSDSWGRSSQLKDIVVNCGYYQGQFDPTLDKTYQVVADVLKEVNQMFIDPVVHLGGDEVNTNCWDKKPSIKQWMSKNNIPNYVALQEHFRKRQKQLWRTFSNKTLTYWANQQVDIHTDKDDIIQWWGGSENVKVLSNRTNKIVLSNYNLAYLDIGYGNRYGGDYGTTIETWKMMYDLNPVIESIKNNILGAEALLWSQVSNDNTHHQKMWPRASSTIQRVWNTHVTPGTYASIVNRLAEQGRRLTRRGIPAMAVTVQLCERYAENCFF